MEETGILRKASPYSKEALNIAYSYDNDLDTWGKQAVRELLETEVARCEVSFNPESIDVKNH